MQVKTLRRIGATLVTVACLALSGCSGGTERTASTDSSTDSPSDPAAGRSPTSSTSPDDDDLTVIQPGRPGEVASTGAPTELPPTPELNDADITFVQMMVPHHAQALEMSELAADYAVDDRVRILAGRIRAEQAPEILSMSSWLADLGREVPDDDMAGMAGMSGMTGMLTESEMDKLASARGPAFDRLFLDGMIRHHRGALEMAGTVARDGAAVLVSELAADVNATQTAEILRMEELLADI